MGENAATTTRRWPLWTAAAIAAGILIAHVFAGQPENLSPLLASDLDPPVMQVFQVLWHVSTLLLATFPLALGWAARTDRAAALPVLVYVWVMFAGHHHPPGLVRSHLSASTWFAGEFRKVWGDC